MSNSPLDRKICYCAMWCHLAILSGEPLIIGILAIFPKILPQSAKVEQNLNIFFGFLFFSPVLGCLLSIILAVTIWRQNRRRHPFIEESGREVVNCLLSVTLYLVVLDSIIYVNCTYGDVLRTNLEALLGLVTMFGIFVHIVITLLVLTNAIAASIQAVKGKLFHYPFIIRFFS